MIKRMAVFLLVLFLAACAGQDEKSDGIGASEIVPLTETRLTNFLAALPVILDFADAYNARMTARDREDPRANEKYFQALRDSSRIRTVSENRGFASVDELMLVYKNVLLEYVSIKKELTNEAAISNLRIRIDETLSNVTARLDSGAESPRETRELRRQLEDLKKDDIRYGNILLVKKYESELDLASRNR